MDFDEMKNQTEKLAGEHPDQVDQAVDKAVDSGADVAKERSATTTRSTRAPAS